MQIHFKQHISHRIYPIGFKFEHKQGMREPCEYTVAGYHITHDETGRVLKFEYNVIHAFYAQDISDIICQTTIDRATNNGWKTKEHAQTLWNDFGNTPINNDDETEEDWLHFEAGCDRFAIWHWFEETFDISVAELT